MDVSDARITTSGSHYHHHCSYNKSENLSGLGSHDPKYYDQIITKVNLQARKQQQHERLLRDQTAISGKRVLRSNAS